MSEHSAEKGLRRYDRLCEREDCSRRLPHWWNAETCPENTTRPIPPGKGDSDAAE